MKYSDTILLAHIPVLAAFVSSIYLYRRLGKSLKVLCLFILMSGVIQFTSLYLYFHKINNLPLLHIYDCGSIILLSWFYRVVLTGFIHPRVIWGASLIFVLFCVANTLFIQTLFFFNSYALIAESMLFIILSLFTFLRLLGSSTRGKGITDMVSVSWVNSGLFIYFLSCFLIYYFADIIANDFTLAFRRVAWMFHAFFSVVMYCCLLVGLWKHEKLPD